jgi:hypothetical protein
MSIAPPAIDDVIPAEYRTAAGDLFPIETDAPLGSVLDRCLKFAESLGISEDYRPLLSDVADIRSRADRRILGHFRNNVDLLIQKTWVEKADESYKEKLLNRIPSLVADLEGTDYEHALKTLIHIVDELAYLLFGGQSRKGDFIEYVFRIDPCLGLFWWYAGRLSSVVGVCDPERLRPLILLGVCFLADL